MLLLFLWSSRRKWVIRWVWERGEAVYSCLPPRFCISLASPTYGFLPPSCNFWWKRFSPPAVAAWFRPQSFVISGALFHAFAGEKRSIIPADYLCSCLQCLCETEQRGIRTHKNTFLAESGNDRFKDGRSQAKLTETLFKRRPNGAISCEQRSCRWFIAGANKNLLIPYKSQHCWDKRGRHNGVWLITLQTLGWHVHAHTHSNTHRL